MNKIQKQDVKTSAELTGAGATDASMIGTDQIYDVTNAKTLKAAIDANDIGSGMVDPMTANGDIITRIAGVADNLAIGTAGQVLTVVGGLPAWAAGGGGGSLVDRAFNNQTGTTYTLALTDSVKNSNKLVTFSNAAQQLVTVPPNSSIAFPVGSQIDCIRLGVGLVVLSPGAGVTINSKLGYLASFAQYSFFSLIQTSADVWDLVLDIGPSFIDASGGALTTDGDYYVHTFTSSSNFTINSGTGSVDYLIIAAGGGGGYNSGGGGGAGGRRSGAFTMSAGVFAVTIPAGGAGGVSTGDGGTSGGNATVNAITSTGGGRGGGQSQAPESGGSGGGHVSKNTPGTIGLGTVGQGNDGGSGISDFATYDHGGGGGGSSAIGANATAGAGGAGGAGTASSITGSSVTKAGGGGGGAGGTGTFGGGGVGGGGAGAFVTGVNGTVNTGGGAGGGGTASSGGNGGAGVVILRYKFQ